MSDLVVKISFEGIGGKKGFYGGGILKKTLRKPSAFWIEVQFDTQGELNPRVVKQQISAINSSGNSDKTILNHFFFFF